MEENMVVKEDVITGRDSFVMKCTGCYFPLALVQNVKSCL